MKRHQFNQFTLIELLVVIGIIGILATVVVPKVTSGLDKASEVAAQTAAGTFEKAMITYDIENKNTVKNDTKSIVGTSYGTVETGVKLYLFLSGQKDWTSGALVDTVTQNAGETDKFTITADGTDYFEPRTSIEALELDSSGYLYDAAVDEEPPFIQNGFGSRYQFTIRTGLDGGSVTVYNPNDPATTCVLKGIKRGDTKLRVISFTSSSPIQVIAKEGIYDLYSDAAKTTLATEAECDAWGGFYVKLR